jgi:hypothetical protein
MSPPKDVITARCGTAVIEIGANAEILSSVVVFRDQAEAEAYLREIAEEIPDAVVMPAADGSGIGFTDGDIVTRTCPAILRYPRDA